MPVNIVDHRSRYSKAIETSVKDLLDVVKSGLKPEELVKMSTPDPRNNEPDAYTALLNMFTQRNIDALVKCTSSACTTPFAIIIIIISNIITTFINTIKNLPKVSIHICSSFESFIR